MRRLMGLLPQTRRSAAKDGERELSRDRTSTEVLARWRPVDHQVQDSAVDPALSVGK